MRKAPNFQICTALAAAAFLAGAGVGACLTPGLGVVAPLVAVNGALLVLAFRLYESRASDQEVRITTLEDHRVVMERQNDRLEALADSVSRALASTLNNVPFADGAGSRVAALAAAIARELNLDQDTLSSLRTAALLHDLGRAGVAADIWARPGPLSHAEWEQVHAHPTHGADLLRAVDMPVGVEEIVRAHQERWDGAGYPLRLEGRRIPLGARILAVADAYEAMTSHRPWRDALSHKEALRRLREEAGAAFDPTVIAAFERAASRGDFLDITSAPLENEKNPAASYETAGKGGADERI